MHIAALVARMKAEATYRAVRKHLESRLLASSRCPETAALLAFVLVLMGKPWLAEEHLARSRSVCSSAGHLMLLLAHHKQPHKIVPFLHP